jgi:hypothetical protein
VLFDQVVGVPAGTGTTDVGFDASNGQHIQILLIPRSPGVQPNIFLQNPDGTPVDIPPIDLLSNGENVVEIWLDQTGPYRLSVFDASGQGGEISVKITVVN